MSVVAKDVFFIHPDDVVLVPCDFKLLLNSGEALSSVTSVTAQTGAGLTIGASAIDGTRVDTWISTPTTGVDYRCEFKVATSDGNTRSADVIVRCNRFPLDEHIKQPSEDIPFTMDFIDRLRSGETVTATTTVTDSEGTAVVISASTLYLSQGVTVQVSSGNDEDLAKLKFPAVTSLSQTIVREAWLRVKDS